VVEEVTVVNVAHVASAPRLDIAIRYRIKATNEPQNLVYPFYLEQR
jgi:hypothetical protein